MTRDMLEEFFHKDHYQVYEEAMEVVIMVTGEWYEIVTNEVCYSLRLNHRKVHHRKFDLLSESGSLMWQKSLSNVLDLDSFIVILSNMNLVSDFVR